MKKRIVFVVDTLVQHGAERYLYELIKALKKENCDLAVYAIYPLDNVKKYYLPLIEELGVTVIIENGELYNLIKSPLLRKVLNSISYRVIEKLRPGYIQHKLEEKLLCFLNDYDIVSIIKWDVYNEKPQLFDRLRHKKIHIMSVLEQYAENPYMRLPQGSTDFILMFPEQKEEILINNHKAGNYRFFTIPLLIDNSDWSNKYRPKSDEVLRIAIFSRICHDQPTIFIFFIIHELKERGIPVELYFFGRYYDEDFYNHYLTTIKSLKITGQVKFMGHVSDIGNAINDNQLNIGVMNSSNNIVGYSSIELQSHGLPLIFFNLNDSKLKTDSFPYICNTMSELAERIISLWKSKEALTQLSEVTFAYSKEEYGIMANQKKIREIFELET